MTYPSDLNDEQWELIKDHFSTSTYGKSSNYNQKVLINAVFYVIKTSCQWRFLPNEYSPWKTVYSFYKWAKHRGCWEKMMRALVEKSYIKMGRNPDPSYLIDSQSVKTTDKAHEQEIKREKR